MTTAFDLIVEDFLDDLAAIEHVVSEFDSPARLAKARVAAANSAALLVAATFEEFIREMARQFAKAVVQNSSSFRQVPQQITTTAWKRTMERFAKIKFDADASGVTIQTAIADAASKLNAFDEFCRGDLSRDIYENLIHNENNMKPTEINGLFKVSGVHDVCKQICDQQILRDELGISDSGRAHGALLETLEQFFRRRNQIAHALNPGSSTSPSQILSDIRLLSALARSLGNFLSDRLRVSAA